MKAGAASVPPPQIPLAFVGAALLTLGAALAWTALAPPPGLALLHLLVVGVFLTVAMGLLYQFVPVVAMAPLRLPYAAFVHLGLAVAGTPCIAIGFARGDFSLVRTGGWLHLAGIVVQIVVLALTLRGRTPPAAAAGAALSLVWLLATIALGVWIAGRLARDVFVADLPVLHALLGLGGFFGTLLTAVSFRLMRMFERVNLEARTPVLAVAVSLCAAVAALGGSRGAFALLAGAVAVAVNVAIVFRARDPAYQRETFAYGAASALGAVAAAGTYAMGNGATAVLLAVWFYAGTAVIGYLQRIVPFIWWIRRSRREGAANVPTLAEMNSTKLGYLVLALWSASGCLWLAHPGDRLAACGALGAWIALLVQLSRPFLLGQAARRRSVNQR